MTYLLDSSVLIRFFQKRDDAIALIDDLRKKGKLAISILSVAELRAGWTKEQAEQLLPRLYKLATIEPITNEIAELSGRLRNEYKLKGKTLHTIDMVIAATSIAKECYLVTFDKDFYPVSEVEVYKI